MTKEKKELLLYIEDVLPKHEYTQQEIAVLFKNSQSTISKNLKEAKLEKKIKTLEEENNFLKEQIINKKVEVKKDTNIIPFKAKEI